MACKAFFIQKVLVQISGQRKAVEQKNVISLSFCFITTFYEKKRKLEKQQINEMRMLMVAFKRFLKLLPCTITWSVRAQVPSTWYL